MSETTTSHPGAEITIAWQAHREALFRFVRRRVSDEATAEDIVQDVLVKAYSRLGELRSPGRLRAWMYEVTRNAIVDTYRSKKPTESLPSGALDDLPGKTSPPDGSEAEQELARCLRPMVDALPEPYRQALILAEFERVKQREIAVRLGLSFSGAKSRVQRARRMLHGAMLDCCRVERDMRGGVADYEVRDGCDACSGEAR